MNYEKIRSFSENMWMVFIARLAVIVTPFAATALVWFGMTWLYGQFEKIAVPLQKVETRIDTLERGDRASELKNQSQDFLIQSNNASVSKVAGEVEKLGRKIDEVNSSLQSLTSVLADRERRANLGRGE